MPGGGFLSSLKKEATKIGRDVSRGVDSFSKDVNKAVDEHWSSPILDAFSTGNVVQLVSRSSGKSLQIVQSSSGQLVVDGVGQEGPSAYNAHWRIINHGKNIISLQNQDNFLALKDGTIYLVYIPPGTPAGIETLFRLSQIDKNFIMLISKKEENCRLGILKDGQLKSPIGTGSEWDAQFGVRVIATYNAAAAAHPPK